MPATGSTSNSGSSCPSAAFVASRNDYKTQRENCRVGAEGGKEEKEMKLVIQEAKFPASKLHLFTEPPAGFRHLD